MPFEVSEQDMMFFEPQTRHLCASPSVCRSPPPLVTQSSLNGSVHMAEPSLRDEEFVPDSVRQQLLEILHLLPDEEQETLTPATRHRLLDASVKSLSLVQDLFPEHQRRHELLELIADEHLSHYEATHEWDTLESAQKYLAELASEIDEDDTIATSRIRYKSSRYHFSRFVHAGRDDDLEEAIALARLSVKETEESGASEDNVALLAERKLQLASCLCAMATELGQFSATSMNEAVELHEDICQSLEGRDDIYALPLQALEGLVNSLMIRWENAPLADKQAYVGDLERSIKITQQVVNILSNTAEPTAMAQALSNASYALRAAYKFYLHTGSVLESYNEPQMHQLGHAALEKLAQSIEYEHAPVAHVQNIFIFASSLPEYPQGPREDLLKGLYPILKRGVQMLQDILYISLPGDREQKLKSYYGLSRYAAAAALQANATAVEALQLLEQGRAVTMSMQLSLDDGQQTLGNGSMTKPSVETYIVARSALLQSVSSGKPFHERYARLHDFYTAQREAWNELPLEETTQYLEEAHLKSLASDGTKIMINTTDIRCDAFIITHDKISVFPLPQLNETELSKKSWEVQQCLARIDDQTDLLPSLYKGLSELLQWLWRVLAKPVLDTLGYEACNSGWPRVTWILTGVLSLYPIHAAGLGLHKTSNVMNRVISTYVPTLKLLALTRSRASARSEVPSIENPLRTTVITMTETPERRRLDSEREFAAVSEHLPGTDKLPQPSGQDVLDLLAGEEAPSIVHVSCHGEVDYDFPNKSRLLMRDWQANPLTLDKLRQNSSAKETRLAFLSACFTANAGVENLQDEAEHLASTMQAAGFESVVGGLWAVEEEAALAITGHFYRCLADVLQGKKLDTGSVAEALHLAVWSFAQSKCELSRKGDPVQWAPFVCYGG